jgi:broad specificity phosphatase PhoE
MSAPLSIFLIRHAEPKVKHPRWGNHRRIAEYFSAYDLAGVDEVLARPQGLDFEDLKEVVCSPMPRARQTALALFGNAIELKEDPRFVEFGRLLLPLPFIWLPLSWWKVIGRIWWALGLKHSQGESYREARKRAQECAEHLAEKAKIDGQVVLVPHGMLNYFISRELRRLGWQLIRKSNGYMGVTQLSKLDQAVASGK